MKTNWNETDHSSKSLVVVNLTANRSFASSNGIKWLGDSKGGNYTAVQKEDSLRGQAAQTRATPNQRLNRQFCI